MHVALSEYVPSRDAISMRYSLVRRHSESLCLPLATEDYGLQAMPDTSPTRWHLAHTTWFFETFLLKPFISTYNPFHKQFDYLFNSYYETIGSPYPRAARGLLSRPTTEEVFLYRSHVDAIISNLVENVVEDDWPEVASRITLGCRHEEQHQELMLTDIKYNFFVNPLRPVYRSDLSDRSLAPSGVSKLSGWIPFSAGIYEIGHEGKEFAFDNESPRHRVYLAPYALASRLVTNAEYFEFIESGGYEHAEFWLADGWRTVCEKGWKSPLYYERIDGAWMQFTLSGVRPIVGDEPVCHVSYYEADAYARFRGERLPTEQEWEVAGATLVPQGNFRESDFLHPQPSHDGDRLTQLFGDVWEWTASAYAPYPGYRPVMGALGEYNGKFMANQMVLRGGSCVTPSGHVGATYRNFFYPPDRWQFSGIRLARDV